MFDIFGREGGSGQIPFFVPAPNKGRQVSFPLTDKHLFRSGEEQKFGWVFFFSSFRLSVGTLWSFSCTPIRRMAF